nr:lrr receptor-like serine/threonine-protein kinase fei 2 [Quercus suber]
MASVRAGRGSFKFEKMWLRTEGLIRRGNILFRFRGSLVFILAQKLKVLKSDLVAGVLSGKRPTGASFIEKGLNIVGWLNFLVTENMQREIVDTVQGGAGRQSSCTALSCHSVCLF